MLKYIIRCFEYSALGCTIMCIWNMAIALMRIEDKLEK